MPPIRRHIVPNIPALAVGDGKPCYRGGAPSCQRLMLGAVEWHGNPDYSGYVSYPMTLTGAEINEALSAAGTGSTFYYAQSLWYFGDDSYHVLASQTKRIRLNGQVSLVYDATGWKWRAEIDDFQAQRPQYPEDQPPYEYWVGPQVCSDPAHIGIFESAHMDAAFRLGNGIRLDFVGLDEPWTNANIWRNTAFNGCWLMVSAQWA